MLEVESGVDDGDQARVVGIEHQLAAFSDRAAHDPLAAEQFVETATAISEAFGVELHLDKPKADILLTTAPGELEAHLGAWLGDVRAPVLFNAALFSSEIAGVASGSPEFWSPPTPRTEEDPGGGSRNR